MKRNRSLSILALAMSMAGVTTVGQVAQSAQLINTSQQVQEIKGTQVKRERYKKKIQLQSGGLDLVHHIPDYGMSPKEYGMRYGHGNSSGKSNRLRYSHNAKLKRRTQS